MTRTTTAGYLSRCLFIVAIVLIVREHVDCGRTDEIESTPKPVEGLGTLHIPPLFDPDVAEIPKKQHEFLDQSFDKNKPFFEEILDYALKNRGKMAASVRLLTKYGMKFLRVVLGVVKEMKNIEPRVDPAPAYYGMLSTIIEQVIDESTRIKKSGIYKSSDIDPAEFKARVTKAYTTAEHIVEQSPAASYLRWDKWVLYEEKKPIVKEASELWAQFRVMGYESTVFIAKRLVTMFRMLSRGEMPDKVETL